MKVKESKGIVLSDAIIAITIFAIFSTIIIIISYNIYLNANFIKRNDTATNYIVDIFEYAKAQNVDDVNYDFLSGYASNKYGDTVNVTNSIPESNNIGSGYTIYIVVNDIHNDNEQYIENVIKQINITVYYKLAKQPKNVTMSTLITR